MKHTHTSIVNFYLFFIQFKPRSLLQLSFQKGFKHEYAHHFHRNTQYKLKGMYRTNDATKINSIFRSPIMIAYNVYMPTLKIMLMFLGIVQMILLL